MNAEKLTGQPVSNPYKFASEIAWLREAARYFSSRPTGGEDAAHWSNVYNAENANKIASRLDALPAPMEAVAWRWLPLHKGKKEPWMDGDATPWVYWTGSAKPDFSACRAGDIIDLQPLYTHPAPIKPSADTGELRGEVIAAVVANVHVSDGRTFINGPAIADAILDLIQSERGSSPIGQNDQPGLAFSDAGEP